MILIVDSGSTKTDWIALDNNGNELFSTQTLGLNPQMLSNEILNERIKNNFDILLAGGQDHMKGKIFRVGHLGYVNDRDIITVVSAIGNTLLDLGKITAKQAGEALVVVSKYLEKN